MRESRRARAVGTAVGALTIASTLALALAGCAPTAGGTGGGSTPHSIRGTWRLVSGSDSTGALAIDGAAVTLKIDGTHSGGQGPCNGYGADISAATAGPLTIKRGIATTMACEAAERNSLESRYFAALSGVKEARLKAGELTLTGTGVTLGFARAGK